LQNGKPAAGSLYRQTRVLRRRALPHYHHSPAAFLRPFPQVSSHLKPMFQTFETRSDPTLAADRISRLREEMRRLDLSAYIVPRADEHQGEYVPSCAERLH